MRKRDREREKSGDKIDKVFVLVPEQNVGVWLGVCQCNRVKMLQTMRKSLYKYYWSCPCVDVDLSCGHFFHSHTQFVVYRLEWCRLIDPESV